MLDKNIDVDEDTNGSKNLLNLEAPTSDDDTLAQNMLCRLAAIVLTKVQRRSHVWELWSQDKCASISKLCILIEEKEVLLKPLGQGEGENVYSRDNQILLLSALLDVMTYGREVTGWCQLILPTPPAIDGGNHDDFSDFFLAKRKRRKKPIYFCPQSLHPHRRARSYRFSSLL
jgi:hypothetical protein